MSLAGMMLPSFVHKSTFGDRTENQSINSSRRWVLPHLALDSVTHLAAAVGPVLSRWPTYLPKLRAVFLSHGYCLDKLIKGRTFLVQVPKL